MKRKHVIRELKKHGWWILRQGSRHEIWTNGRDTVPVGRHPEIPEKTALFGIIQIAKNNPGPRK